MMGMKETVSNIVTSQAEKGGVKHVYYVACGGSYAAFYPAKAFLEKEAKALTVGLYNSGEFINNPAGSAGKKMPLWLSPPTKVIRQRQLKRLKSPVSTARRSLV
ncbi:putative phosphosugar isomerase [Salmonella enterica subsp. enterica]|uniref:Putative phosphosugar isomerase n=1 Tax=Salmonella enterica I TaxID=59201 RepID=A0A447P4F8_SALET|nr:putative phosphosugar isomerase [Salmonella enterica subsp. enterica]